MRITTPPISNTVDLGGKEMSISRRAVLAGSALGLAGTSAAKAGAAPRGLDTLADRIRALFEPLPGRVAFKFVAPATASAPAFAAEESADARLFVGSAIKTFILCEALRQLDGPSVVESLRRTQLQLDASVWSADSQIFNPPDLSGRASLRTALEAMIMHSDNTGTDMALMHAGVDNVRKFITEAGLDSTAIPDSTRIFFGYLLGAPDYKTFTWDELVAALEKDAPFVNPPLNDVETLASSADDLVTYYARALQGEFFQHPETLAEFRRILTLADAIARVFPLGVSGFAKGGSIDVPGFHCLCLPGGMFFDDRWVYFAMIINWNAPPLSDPDTVGAFADAARRALELVKDTLGA